MYKIILIILCFVPITLKADVRISEIAWMGTATSANDEWIELFNDGPTTNLDGWVLSDNNGLIINLAGSVAAGAYIVLERTDDDSAPGSAFLIYTGALANTGSNLTLRNTSGEIVDSVVGGVDWANIGGDNVTKQTPQLSASGWQTAAATPQSGPLTYSNAGNEQPLTNQTNTSSNITKSSKSSGGAAAKPTEPEKDNFMATDHKLVTQIIAPTIAYVNQPVTFYASSSGMGDGVLDSLDYKWNFGDLSTGHTKETEHIFAYAGEYVVYLESSYNDYIASSRHTIEVRQMPVELTVINNNLQITNTASYEIDMSNFLIKGKKTIKIPNHTLLLTEESITIPLSKLGNTTGQSVYLYDSAGVLLGAVNGHLNNTIHNVTKPITYLPTTRPTKKVSEKSADDDVSVNSTYQPLALASLSNNFNPPTINPNSTNSSESKNDKSLLTYLGLVGTAALGVIGTLSLGL